ncbi:MAG: 4'-phosphopantetheinyl transferase superfamily protein [Pseudomonadota bacterium]
MTVSRHDWLGGLGVDIELANAATPGVERLTLTSRELACLQKSGTRLSATKMFSAKEAVFKAVNTMTDHMIGFQDVELDFDQEAKCFSAAYSGERQANAIMACGAGLSSAYRNHVISWFLVPRSEY